MKIERRLLLGVFVVLLPLLVLGIRARANHSEREEVKVRWDLINLGSSGGSTTVNAGGVASALASDNSKITFTGSGTFEIGESEEVTGGGTWKTFAPGGTTLTGMGTYRVKRLIHFEFAPGALNPANIDNIGDKADARAGLAILRIRYSDGSSGILVVPCHAVGTPNSVFEGITASKGFVDFFNPQEPVGGGGGANANRTLFHVVPATED